MTEITADTQPLLAAIHKLQARKEYNFYKILVALEKALPQYFIENNPDYLTLNQLCQVIRQWGRVDILNCELHITDWTLTKHYIYP